VTATADGVGRFSRRAALAVLGVVTAAGAAIAVAGAVIARGSPQGRFERTLAVSGPTNIAITTGSGSILVRPGDSSTVRVVGNIQVSADWNEDEREAQEKVRRIEANPPIDQDGDSVRIGEIRDDALRRGISISYEIIVPASTRLRAFTGSGSIDAQGLGGMLAESGSGAISLQQQAPGDIEVKTGSGSIKLAGLRGGVLARSGSGSIDAQGSPARDWHVRTGSGNVKIRLPADASFELVASTGSGRVRTSRELLVTGIQDRRKVRGKANRGGPLIDITTGSGNIEVD
jgi:Putative adhesin